MENNKARIDFPNGEYYIGDIKNRFFHGKGLNYSLEHGTYDGEWRYGLQ